MKIFRWLLTLSWNNYPEIQKISLSKLRYAPFSPFQFSNMNPKIDTEYLSCLLPAPLSICFPLELVSYNVNVMLIILIDVM